MKRYLPLILVVGALGLLLVVVGCRTQQRSATPPPSSQATAPATVTPTASTAGQKITIGPDEASCPVLGTVMKKSGMIPIQHNGKTYYMCCADCQAKFKANPEKYIQHPAPLTRDMPHD